MTMFFLRRALPRVDARGLCLAAALLFAAPAAALAAGAAPVQLEIGGMPISPTNPLPLGCAVGGATVSCSAAFGSSFPADGSAVGAESSGNLIGLVQADTSAAINISTATTTQLVALSSGKKIYVASFDVVAGGTGNITFEYGTGTSCGTGTTALTGAYNLTAQAGVALGGALGPVLVVPAGNALCALTSAAVQMSGSLSYTQF